MKTIKLSSEASSLTCENSLDCEMLKFTCGNDGLLPPESPELEVSSGPFSVLLF